MEMGESKLMSLLKRMIRAAVIILLTLALFFAFQSDTLRVDRLTSKFMILLGVLVVMLFIILLGSPRNTIKTGGGRFFLKHHRIIFLGIFSILVIYQIIVLLIVKVKLQFDVLGLLNGLYDKEAVGIYLSNNRLLFYIFYWLNHIFGLKVFGL